MTPEEIDEAMRLDEVTEIAKRIPYGQQSEFADLELLVVAGQPSRRNVYARPMFQVLEDLYETDEELEEGRFIFMTPFYSFRSSASAGRSMSCPRCDSFAYSSCPRHLDAPPGFNRDFFATLKLALANSGPGEMVFL